MTQQHNAITDMSARTYTPKTLEETLEYLEQCDKASLAGNGLRPTREALQGCLDMLHLAGYSVKNTALQSWIHARWGDILELNAAPLLERTPAGSGAAGAGFAVDSAALETLRTMFATMAAAMPKVMEGWPASAAVPVGPPPSPTSAPASRTPIPQTPAPLPAPQAPRVAINAGGVDDRGMLLQGLRLALAAWDAETHYTENPNSTAARNGTRSANAAWHKWMNGNVRIIEDLKKLEDGR